MEPFGERLSGTGSRSAAAKRTRSLPVAPFDQTRSAVRFRNYCFYSPTLPSINERPLISRSIKTTDECNDPTLKYADEKVWEPFRDRQTSEFRSLMVITVVP